MGKKLYKRQKHAKRRKQGYCDVCCTYTSWIEGNYLDEHHVYPHRWFSTSRETKEMCRLCHNELERKIKRAERGNGFRALPAYMYKQIFDRFVYHKRKRG